MLCRQHEHLSIRVDNASIHAIIHLGKLNLGPLKVAAPDHALFIYYFSI